MGVLKNNDFDPALLAFVQNGSMKVLQAFLQNEDADAVDSSGKTLLHHAVKSKNCSMAKHLIESKYKLDIIDNDGNTPLMLAVKCGSLAMAKMLIRADADIYTCDSEGKSVLLLLHSVFHKEISSKIFDEKLNFIHEHCEYVKAILEKVRKDCWSDRELFVSKLRELSCSLVQAVCLRDADVIRMMLDSGYYSVDERELETKDSALHKAVQISEYNVAKVLIEYGVDVGLRNKDGLPPIYLYNNGLANTEEKIKTLMVLIEHGALSIESTPSLNITTPTNHILATGSLSICKTVLQCKFSHPLDTFCLFLYSLVVNSNVDALEAVRGEKFDVNVDDDWCPFIAAIRYDFSPSRKVYLSIIMLLLEHGADAQYSGQIYTMSDPWSEKTVFDLAANNVFIGDVGDLEIVIAHLAMRESLGETITDLIRSKIDSKETYKAHYQACQRQLEKTKNTTLYESVTLFRLLIDSQPRINKFARNRQFASEFAEKMKNEKLHLYYSVRLRKRVGKAIARAKWTEQAVVALNEIIEYQLENASQVVEYLPSSELKNICCVNNLHESDSFDFENLFV